MRIVPERVERCEEDGLSSFFAFSSSSDEKTSSMKKELFPFVWSSDVKNLLKHYQIPTSVSLNGTKIH